MSRALYPFVDRLLNGTLERRLTRWRGEGLTYEQIADRLRDEGIDVVKETVRKWCMDVGAEKAS